MKEYIEREALMQSIENYPHLPVSRLIKEAPTADVEPVVHAKWEIIEEEGFWIQNMQESIETGKPTKTKLPVCSHCKTKFGTLVLDYKRCPNCGAYMDGGK